MNVNQGVFIDIARMKQTQLKLQESHVKNHPKDEAPKRKLRKLSSKIKKLQEYAKNKYKNINK